MYGALQVTKLAVPDGGLFYMHSPDPDWRNEADCGMAEYKRSDGSTLALNCAGPKHAYFRSGVLLLHSLATAAVPDLSGYCCLGTTWDSSGITLRQCQDIGHSHMCPC